MARYRLTPIIEEIKDAPPPHELFKNIKDSRYSFFLDSATGHERLGRYSFLGCDPFLVFKAKRDSVKLEWAEEKVRNFKANPFFALKDLFEKYSVFKDKDLPFAAGGVGYFAYDMKKFVERLPDKAVDDLGIPDCIFGFYDIVIICDNLKHAAYISSSGLPFVDPVKARRRQTSRLKNLKDKLRYRPAQRDSASIFKPAILRSNFSFNSYAKAIEKAKEYIKRGDIYQVNLSQRFEAELSAEPFKLYSRLRCINPAPFSSYLNFGDVTILSSSPERFLLKRGSYIETRPIKGTRPRGEGILSDMLLEKELIASQKDRAEHVMILDLERNDLGRICEYGSVKPTEFIILEKYSTVYHLVSTVSGRLRKGISPVDCLLAAFPGGSITGAPKIRAMEIIDELEPVKRSIYTGAIGYISFGGNMDTSIVIRTFIIKNGKIFFSAGGGIVADSDPESEYDETLDKARALIESLGFESTSSEKVFA